MRNNGVITFIKISVKNSACTIFLLNSSKMNGQWGSGHRPPPLKITEFWFKSRKFLNFGQNKAEKALFYVISGYF